MLFYRPENTPLTDSPGTNPHGEIHTRDSTLMKDRLNLCSSGLRGIDAASRDFVYYEPQSVILNRREEGGDNIGA